jgi:hypothetical protein
LAIIDFLTNAFFFRINVSSSQHRPRNTVQLWEETANRSSLHRSWGLQKECSIIAVRRFIIIRFSSLALGHRKGDAPGGHGERNGSVV